MINYPTRSRRAVDAGGGALAAMGPAVMLAVRNAAGQRAGLTLRTSCIRFRFAGHHEAG
jgi:hypothetical protein